MSGYHQVTYLYHGTNPTSYKKKETRKFKMKEKNNDRKQILKKRKKTNKKNRRSTNKKAKKIIQILTETKGPDKDVFLKNFKK